MHTKLQVVGQNPKKRFSIVNMLLAQSPGPFANEWSKRMEQILSRISTSTQLRLTSVTPLTHLFKPPREKLKRAGIATANKSTIQTHRVQSHRVLPCSPPCRAVRLLASRCGWWARVMSYTCDVGWGGASTVCGISPAYATHSGERSSARALGLENLDRLCVLWGACCAQLLCHVLCAGAP